MDAPPLDLATHRLTWTATLWGHAGDTMDGVTMNLFTGSAHPSLFGDDASADAREPVLMALNPIYFDLIWTGEKRYEFRRRFVTGQSVRWYVYLTAPMAHVGAVIDLGGVVGTPSESPTSLSRPARATAPRCSSTCRGLFAERRGTR
ncbi:hypothetical protein [Micromonospora sp. WMMD714]|uniref:hypothetical protein n=1 Tax=Micromonospora sp. WMMD714 TaxID=3016097 RepID=UPI00249C2B7B|nr:hypothetical protein [Micromonospora sp. WMMD714]WFE64270.1 hypothetical protein O7625_13715 [Micromonospora sp. WMMD714]